MARGAVTAAALASELASRDASISGLQASKADASALTAYALQSAVDTSSVVDSKIAAALLNAVTTAALDAALLGKADASVLASLLSTVDGLPLEVDTKIANALLGLATEAFVAAQLASRDAGITALQASKADTALLASYATNAALSASKTALQSALDAILAELAALQLSGSGVVNAPAWAGFTTWELLRGSSVVRNLHFVAPLSAALANGDDTLSITADCYSTAGTDAAITAALLAYYTSSQVDTLLGDYRTGTAQDAETTSAITGALLAYYTAAQVDALLGDYRTASAQDTQTQAAITGALLAYRTGPDQDVFTTNQITSALVAYRSAADQDTATTSSIAAALLSYYTITQVDGLLANKLGVTEAASALQIAVRFPDDGGADEVVAAIGEQILGPTDVSLSNWTVRPSSGCSVALATHTAGVSVGGEPVEHRAHLQLDARARAALRLPLPARHGLQLRAAHVRGRQRLRPVVRQLRGRPGRLEHGQDVLHSAAKRSCEAALRCALPGAGPAQPNGRNGGRLRPPDPGRNPGGRQHGGGVSTGSVVCGDVTSSGTVSAPQLFASNTLTVTNTSDFSDDLFLTKNWAGWSKLQVSNNSAAPDSGPELRLLGNQSARVFLERDGGAHQCELIMINDEALVQTKSLSTQLSLTTNQRNPGCLVIAGNTGNVVCNTSFTDLSDSRVKTEIAEANVAELLQLFDSVEAKQYKRPDMNGDLRLGFASDDFAGTKWKNLTGTTQWSDGTEMVTLDYSHLTSVLWGVCKGFQARLDALEAWQAQRGPKNK